MAINLNKIDTLPPKGTKKKKIKKKTKKLLEKIYEYQRIMYAQGQYSILLIFQGMDAAGKDGAIKDIFSGINPLGCNVSGFKKPTKEELAHDFLRRVHKHTPEKGMIQIFNRSHYEDILVPSVDKYIDAKTIKKRYTHINNFEQLIADNDTKIVKIYLHTSKDEQKERLEERLHLPHKHWKHNDNDRESRKKWDDYRKVYHKVFEECNEIPWHIVPADKNWWKVYQVTKILISVFEDMKLQWPKLESELFDEKDKEVKIIINK